MLDEAGRRRDFPLLAGMTYLNSAAEGIPPLAVGQALERYFADKQRGMAGREAHQERWRALRALTAGFYGLAADEIGICSCTSEAFNLLALALRLREGDQVVINDLDFPAGRTPWLQPGCPATVRVWRAREGALRVEDLAPLLGPRTRLVSSSLVSFYNGFLLPLPAVLEVVRRRSPALLALDVTQALGRIPLELRGVDFIVSSTHKWILGTHGGGLVGVPRARSAELTVPAGGWFNLSGVFEADAGERVRTKPGAESFMVGMPNYPAVYAAAAALEYIRVTSVENIDRAARPLVRECLRGLAALPVDLLTPPGEESLAGILALRGERMDEVHARLLAAGVHVMHSSGRIRVSLHGYNTAADVETLLRTLRSAL